MAFLPANLNSGSDLMSRILKAQNGASITALHQVRVSTQVPNAPEAESVESKVEALEAEILKIKSEHVAELETARKKAFAEGEASALRAHDEKVHALVAAAGLAQQAFEKKLDTLDQLALVIVDNAFDKFANSPEQVKQFLQDLLHQQAGMLRNETVVCVEVSSSDFASVDEVKAILEELGVDSPGGDFIRLLPHKSAGECDIRLSAGDVSISVNEFTREARDRLATAIVGAKQA